MRRALLVLALPVCLLLGSGCADGEGDADRAAVPADSITKRQRDSAIGASGLPGAKGITRALEASDAANAHTAAIDSAAGGS